MRLGWGTVLRVCANLVRMEASHGEGSQRDSYDLSLAILNEEIEHEAWFSEFLGEGPSGHYLRLGDTSPFVSKFLR